MLLADIGVLLFVAWIIFMLLMPTERISLKLIFFWLALVLFCMGGWILALGFVAFMTVFYLLIR